MYQSREPGGITIAQETKTFTIADPRTFDGDPFEVADRTVAQADALLKLTQNAVKDAFVMARNAEMERQIISGDEPDAAAFENGPHGKRFRALWEQMSEDIVTLDRLRTAAGFNPKAPLDG